MAYGALVADTLLPDVLRYTPGTTALWDPWNGVRNGKGLHEELASNFAKMVTNTDFTTGLTQQPRNSSTTSPTSPRHPRPPDRLDRCQPAHARRTTSCVPPGGAAVAFA